MKPNSKFKIKNSKLDKGFTQHHFIQHLFKTPQLAVWVWWFLFLKSGAGFTLVELLASIIVFVAVGSVVAGIVTSSLRGVNKTNVIENIRQSGNYTLAQISRNIEYAAAFGGLSNDGVDYVMSCPSSEAPTPAPVVTQYRFIKITPLDRSPVIYNCGGSTLTITTLSGTIPFIDRDAFSFTDCKFICTQTRSTDTPIIGISFSLGPKDKGLVENSSPPVLFQTSVTIRNYKK